MFRFAFGKLGGLLEFQTAFFAVASKQPEHRFWMRGKIGQRVLCQKGGSWPKFVKRGGLEVLPYFPAHGREGEAAPLLRRNLLILLVQVAILMASRTLAKNRRFAALPERFAVWPQKAKQWHMARLLGVLHKP